MHPVKTIARPVDLEGIGVHSGRPVRLQLKPSDSGGIVFRRIDLAGAEMGLRPECVETRNATSLVGDRFQVRTVEHLLAALYAYDIGSLVVALDADEIPIMDGSALPFVRALERGGTAETGLSIPVFRIMRSLTMGEEDAWIRIDPLPEGEGLVLDYTIAYAHPAIGTQRLSFSPEPSVFAADIAPARTFGFLKDVESYRRQGLALGASFDNTVILDDTAVVNPPLRFEDEFVRHKLLDLMGDLALLGRPLAARVTAHKAGHRLHVRAVRFIVSHPEFGTE